MAIRAVEAGGTGTGTGAGALRGRGVFAVVERRGGCVSEGRRPCRIQYPEIEAQLHAARRSFFSSHRTMKLLMFCGAVALITCASSSVDGDILLEMREEFAQMKTQISELKTENTEMKAEITVLKAQRNATTAGKLEFFVDGRTVCPDDMVEVEVNVTKGVVLLGRTGGGKTGAVFNRALDAGEIGRSPPHSHAVAVNRARPWTHARWDCE